jgi:MFS family permease
MRFLRAFAIGLITGVVGMFLAIFASDYLTRLYHVSDMEGQRGMAVIFLFAPLGLIVGFFIGVTAVLRTRWAGFVGFIKTQALSILIVIAIGGAVSGVLWLGANKPPKIDGKELMLEFELKIPSAIQIPAELNDNTIRASLYVDNRENRHASIDLKSMTKQDSYVIVSGTVALMSHSANRSLFASIGNEPGGSQFIDLKTLPAAPRKENETWSDWTPATQRTDLSPVPEPERIAVRYRVRPVDN